MNIKMQASSPLFIYLFFYFLKDEISKGLLFTLNIISANKVAVRLCLHASHISFPSTENSARKWMQQFCLSHAPVRLTEGQSHLIWYNNAGFNSNRQSFC